MYQVRGLHFGNTAARFERLPFLIPCHAPDRDNFLHWVDANHCCYYIGWFIFRARFEVSLRPVSCIFFTTADKAERFGSDQPPPSPSAPERSQRSRSDSEVHRAVNPGWTGPPGEVERDAYFGEERAPVVFLKSRRR